MINLAKYLSFVTIITICLIILLNYFVNFTYEATRKISKYNFEKTACPQKCKLNQNTRSCLQAQSLSSAKNNNNESSLTVSNICTHYLQQNFDSITDCTNQCRGCNPERMVSKCTKAALTKKFAICNLKPVPGPCEALFTMWYYDTALKDCKTFVYGGCGGNDNKFGSHLECLLRCGLAGFLNSYDFEDNNSIKLKNQESSSSRHWEL